MSLRIQTRAPSVCPPPSLILCLSVRRRAFANPPFPHSYLSLFTGRPSPLNRAQPVASRLVRTASLASRAHQSISWRVCVRVSTVVASLGPASPPADRQPGSQPPNSPAPNQGSPLPAPLRSRSRSPCRSSRVRLVQLLARAPCATSAAASGRTPRRLRPQDCPPR